MQTGLKWIYGSSVLSLLQPDRRQADGAQVAYSITTNETFRRAQGLTIPCRVPRTELIIDAALRFT
jgi:hypothetical protein